MIPPKEHDVEAMYAASDEGGKYLESIGITDLAKMSEDQWMTFIETVVRAFEEKRSELWGNQPPF